MFHEIIRNEPETLSIFVYDFIRVKTSHRCSVFYTARGGLQQAAAPALLRRRRWEDCCILCCGHRTEPHIRRVSLRAGREVVIGEAQRRDGMAARCHSFAKQIAACAG